MDLIHIQSEIIRTDVTALQIFNNYIFAGIGNVLHVFDKYSYQLHFKNPVLEHHRIHGIRLNTTESQLVCFGNREISVFSICFEVFSINIISNINVGDWIWDVKWCNDEMSILTANNIVTQWNWKVKRILKRILNREKCLLYSGLILGDQWCDHIVIGGSMFKTIVIWAPSMNVENSSLCLHKLSNHKGAIFSVFYNSKLCKLASTSDDRSVKVWFVDFPINTASVVQSWSKANIVLQVTVYGHMSRVWKSVVFDDGKFVTAGEDSQLRVWNEDGTPFCFWETHQGASIRSLALDLSTNIVVTGGKDGALHCCYLATDDSSKTVDIDEIHFSKIFEIEKVQDVPRKILLSRLNKLFTVTNEGLVFVYDRSIWKCIYNDVRFSSYCLFHISTSQKFVALASIFGDVVILREEGPHKVIFDMKICKGKILSFHWLLNDEFIVCSEDGQLENWLLADCCEFSPVWKKTGSLVLPKCKERWITSVVRCKELIIIGDRDGSIHLYNGKQLNPVQSHSRVHGRLGVSFINYCSSSERISSVGRDGFIRYWNIVDGKLINVSSDRLPVKWPVRVTNSDSFGIIVMGFNEVNFEVWNINEEKKLLTFTCGGGHRPWDFSISDVIRFIYIKGKILYSVTSSLKDVNVSSILKGNHIREIDCLIFLNENTIMSGSEDTTLRIARVCNGAFSPISTIRSHISSIKAIAGFCKNDLFFIASAGGRYEMKLWQMRVDYDYVDKEELGIVKSKEHDQRDKFDLEPRYMDVKLRLQDNLVLIYSAVSNASWRIDKYDIISKSVTMGSNISYGSFCILKIIPIIWAGEEMVVTLATDGKACFWNQTSMKLIHQKPIHKSGINGCDYEIFNDGVLMLATGGDDTAIALSLFKYSNEAVSDLSYVSGVVHEAQVSGLKIFRNYVFSSGGDQKFIVWNWERNRNTLLLNLKNIYITLIPDIHGLDVFIINYQEVKVCIYGAGLEILKITLPLT